MAINPYIQAVIKGKDPNIVCYSDTTPTFTKDGKHIPKRHKQNGGVLTLHKVSEMDMGLYTCNGTSNSTTFEATSELLVGSKLIFMNNK